MNVLWVFHSGEVGGAPLTGIEALEALERQGHQTLSVVPVERGVAELLRDRGMACVVVPHTRWVRHESFRGSWLRWRRLPRTTLAALSIARLARRWKADVTVTSTITFAAAALGARLAGVPHVWFIQEYGREDFQAVFDWGEARSLRWIDQWSARVIVQSPALFDKFREAFPDGKLVLVTPGVEVPSVDRRPNDGRARTFRMILVGSLQSAKGQKEAIRATSILALRGKNVRLEIAGSGVPEVRESLVSLAEELGVSNRVSFLGFRDDRLALVAGSDVALMCSRSEALGRVTIEAMKLGTPVVAAASGANPYLIEDGETGLLYRTGDPEDLAAKIATLIDDPSRAATIAQKAEQFARDRYSVERLAEDLIRVLASVARRA